MYVYIRRNTRVTELSRYTITHYIQLLYVKIMMIRIYKYIYIIRAGYDAVVYIYIYKHISRVCVVFALLVHYYDFFSSILIFCIYTHTHTHSDVGQSSKR